MLYASKAAVPSPQKPSGYGKRPIQQQNTSAYATKDNDRLNANFSTNTAVPYSPEPKNVMDASDGFENSKVRAMRELLRRDNFVPDG